jgi:hypothetical protein
MNPPETFKQYEFQATGKEKKMANTTAIEDVQERKKLKRAARKKAAPQGPRAGARGENKQKLKKAARGQSKRK